MSRIYLVGFMGVGKSTVGKKLATCMEYEFVDLDHLFETTYKICIDRFFQKYGEELFRKLEYKLLTGTFDRDNVVVSTGGGTPVYGDAMEKMNENGTTVFLNMPVGGITNRLTNAKRKRPLVEQKQDDELQSFVEQRLEERLPVYQKAQITVDTMDIDVEALASKIKDELK